ncbi:MAG: glycosyltransferase family 2 protein [Deltaproteobacteria bacterium]|nr:glycosyltransferase family 2 protein [Deltaproteobacteria bacterium]
MISIIIPAYDCRDEIQGLLDDVGRSALLAEGDAEVIVVDDHSTDDTAAVCEAREGVRVIRQPQNAGPARARNVGAAHARGELLIFIDSDVRLLPGGDILSEMVRVLQERPPVDCVSTLSSPRPTRESAIAYANSIYHAYYMDRILAGRDEVEGRVMFFTTRLGAIRARRFREAGGFYESLRRVMNEDGEFGTRIYHRGYRSYLARHLVHQHRYPTGFGRYLRSYYHSTVAQAQIDRTMDTSADESLSAAEKGRRLYALSFWLLPLLFALLPAAAAAALCGLWVLALPLVLGALGRRMRAETPRRYWVGFHAVYVAITPFIFAGYAVGLLRHSLGDSLFAGPPSTLEYFRQEAAS